MTNEEAKVFLDNLKICINEHPIVADWLVEIADRKTEPQTDCETCRYAGGCDWEPWQECPYTPKNEPQTDCAWSKCDD